MRYVAKILRTSLAEKFPRASEEDVDKVGTCAAWWGGNLRARGSQDLIQTHVLVAISPWT